MKNDYIVRTLYRSFVIVSILTALTATAGILVDNIIVGRFLGSDALGAMGIAGPIGLIFSAVGNICSGGGTARAAQALGKGDREQMCITFTTTILFALVAGVIITVFGLLFTPQIADFLGADGTLKAPTEQYLYGYFLSAIPTIIMTALMGFVRVDGSVKLPLVCIGVMTVSNIIMDLFMALVFRQGMFGMALATAISYFLAAATGCMHFTQKHNSLRILFPKNIWKELYNIITVGAPTSIVRICETIKFTLLNNLLAASVGAAALVALNVRTQAFNLLGALVVGIGQASIPIVGMFFGEEDRNALSDVLHAAFRIGLTITVPIAAVLLIFPTMIPSLLGVTNPATMKMATAAMRILALGMPISLGNTVLMNFYQSTRREKLASLICVLQSLVYPVIFAFILLSPLGITGVWVALFLGDVLTLLTIVVHAARKEKKIPNSLDYFMLFGRDFGGDPENRLEISIGNSIEEVVLISRGIHQFGQKHGTDQKLLGKISLFIEEMAGNVVQHSFRPGEKKWLDMMILNKKDSIVIRLRDNGAGFDPTKYVRIPEDSVSQEQYGIKIVSSFADRFEYRRSMGLNVLIITLNK